MSSFQQLSRRELLKVFTFAGGAMLAGCSDKNPNGTKLTLTQWYHEYGEKGTFQAVQHYAREYSLLNPHIAVRVVWVPGDYGTKLATALLTPDGPDVFEDQLTEAMVSAGQVAPLDDLFTPEDLKDFNAKDIALNSVGGKIYGVKEIDDMQLLYFRKSVLKAAGVKPPTTMDELIAAAHALTTPTRKGIFLGNDGGVTALLTVLPWSAGSDFLVDNRIVFNNPRTVASYEKLLELNQSGSLLMGAPTDWWDPSSLTQGLAAMQWCGLWAYPKIHSILGDDLGAIIWPAFDNAGVPVTSLGGWTAMVNAQRPYVEEAKKFVKWLWIDNLKDQLDWCVGYGFHVPPRLSLAKRAPQLSAPIPAYAVKALGKYGQATPPLWNAAMTSDLTNSLTNIVKLGHNAARSVSNAATQCTRELNRELE